MPGPHQQHRLREDVHVTAADLLQVPAGQRTQAGLQEAVGVGLGYLEAWLGGQGCVPLNHRMEDAATAEIARALLWQWRRHGARLEDGTLVDSALLKKAFQNALLEAREALGNERFSNSHFPEAKAHLERLVLADTFESFLTLIAYGDLIADELMARVS
jgi:malate synthase